MNNRIGTLGIGAAVLGTLAAVVGAALAAKGSAKPTGDAAQADDGSEYAANGPTAQTQSAPTGDEGHAVPDLASDAPLGPDHRAPEAFRPNMDAPMTAAEREALRPPVGPRPSLVS
jgi:hypothetical protein